MSAEQVQALLQLAETADFRAKFDAALPEERRNSLAQAGETPTLLVAAIPPRAPARVSTQSADLRVLK